MQVVSEGSEGLVIEQTCCLFRVRSFIGNMSHERRKEFVFSLHLCFWCRTASRNCNATLKMTMLISGGTSLLSCLPPVWSHLISSCSPFSLPHSSPLSSLLLSSLLSTVHRRLCSAQQFGTFTVTVSRLSYHLRAITYHLRLARHVHTPHTHTIMKTHFHWAFEMWISHLKKTGLFKPIQLWWWNSSRWVILLSPFFFWGGRGF